VRCLVDTHLAGAAFPVRATLFDKTAGANWRVPWHQDLTIPVAARAEVPGYGPWSVKAGVLHVQPPARVLEQMLSVRIHLDDCPASNGALRVLAGTHRLGRLTPGQIAEQRRREAPVACDVAAGGVLLMRPLLLHASYSASQAAHRRVIHIDYACHPLDGGLRWAAEAATGVVNSVG
jgi:ectoine hydroxylase-related dioxygenase (phytanoyl-CoA dioxygenase family)